LPSKLQLIRSKFGYPIYVDSAYCLATIFKPQPLKLPLQFSAFG